MSTPIRLTRLLVSREPVSPMYIMYRHLVYPLNGVFGRLPNNVRCQSNMLPRLDLIEHLTTRFRCETGPIPPHRKKPQIPCESRDGGAPAADSPNA